jgi:hypothetical protein
VLLQFDSYELEFGYLIFLKNILPSLVIWNMGKQLHVEVFCAASIIIPVCIIYRTHGKNYAMWHPPV